MCLVIECIVAVPDLEEAKAIASKKLIGADEITATELSHAKIKASNSRKATCFYSLPFQNRIAGASRLPGVFGFSTFQNSRIVKL